MPGSVPGSAVPGSAVPGLVGGGGGGGGGPSWPSYYTYNFCPNPSVEASTSGYAPILGTEGLSQTRTSFSGQTGLQVTTPGSVPGEGVVTPAGAIIASTTGSASLYIWGETGNLTVQALQNPGGQVLGSIQVQLSGGAFQRVELPNLAMTVNDTFYLAVWTTTAQALTFVIDAVQYEPESPPRPYIDGDSRYAAWAGAAEISASYQQYEFPIMASGGMNLEGTIRLIARGEVFTVGPVAGMMDMSGQYHPMVALSSPSRAVIPPAVDPGIAGLPWEIAGGGSVASTVVLSPGSGFSDFAIWETGVDPDPAMTLIGWNNAGTQNASETATSYTRLFGTFSPPRQTLDSAGVPLWNSAAYMAAGFRIASQAAWSAGAPGAVNFTQVQVEKQTQQGPTAYQLPRSLSTIVKPTRMNYVANPSMEVSLAGWSAIGGAALTQVSAAFEGIHSIQVSVPSPGGGVSISVPDLILGDTFIASAYIEPVSANINDVTMTAGTAEASAAQYNDVYGSGEYGSGPYGGVPDPAVALTTESFGYRPFTAFQAATSAVTLSFTPTAVSGATYPLVFNVDCVLIEPGEVLNPYGDGTTDGWVWELGGTPGLSRSYYYERQAAGASAVQSVLDTHIPLGLTAYAPAFSLPATQ